MKVWVVKYLDYYDGVTYWNLAKILSNEDKAKAYCAEKNLDGWFHYDYDEYEVE